MPKGMTHSAVQIIAALREVDAGVRVGDVCRRLGVVEKTFYRLSPRSATGRMTPSALVVSSGRNC